MPRSFLVKTHSSHRVPNYRQLETQRGEKPYTCSHCSRAFADRSNLRAHLQTHSDTKKYQCKNCAKTFSRMSLLARHEESGCCPGP